MMTAGRRGKQTALAGLKWPNCNFLVRAVSLKESGVWERCQDLSELHMCLCLSHLLTPQQRNLTNKQRGLKRKKKTKQTRGLIIVCVFVRSWVRRDVSSPVAGRTDFQTFISDVRVCVCVCLCCWYVCVYIVKQLEVLWHAEHPEWQVVMATQQDRALTWNHQGCFFQRVNDKPVDLPPSSSISFVTHPDCVQSLWRMSILHFPLITEKFTTACACVCVCVSLPPAGLSNMIKHRSANTNTHIIWDKPAETGLVRPRLQLCSSGTDVYQQPESNAAEGRLEQWRSHSAGLTIVLLFPLPPSLCLPIDPVCHNIPYCKPYRNLDTGAWEEEHSLLKCMCATF